ncbi:uncharacterized protein BDZ99DRAFT_544936 [Mytilinidion resinicola]|uniref:Uncharacterized protein n=1 Tax=Mytilinidion resinicola TaxID=574789 RepID=A0A6A6Y990_9PEZI|nr:uncharacterized protein BDZ99DRAFT_544936 [Mytilinidion resinicola]KAF2804397.1 hypothetical protein BDZ99DRAFT_544936 [Mytilinidion resinicola]
MLPEPTKPAPPAADDSTFAAQMTWKMAYDEYKDDKVLFDKQKESLQDLRIFILQTVDAKYTTYTYGISSARNLLAKLKKSIAPSDKARRDEIYNLWQEQKHYPTERTVEKWLRDWETLGSQQPRISNSYGSLVVVLPCCQRKGVAFLGASLATEALAPRERPPEMEPPLLETTADRPDIEPERPRMRAPAAACCSNAGRSIRGQSQITEGTTWPEISQAARDLTMTEKTLSSHGFMYGTAPYRFGAAPELNPPRPICAALTGLRKWDSPAVLADRDLLLNGSSRDVNPWMAEYRSEIVKEVKRLWPIIQETEKRLFGQKSFFLNMQKHPGRKGMWYPENQRRDKPDHQGVMDMDHEASRA